MHTRRAVKTVKADINCIVKQLRLEETRELKTSRGHMAPPPLHLSDIRCKCFPYRRCHGKQKTIVHGQTNEAVCDGCWKIPYNSLGNETLL